MIDGLAWLIIAFPLLALGIQILFGKKLPRLGDWVSTGAMGLSLLCGLLLFFIVVFWHHDPGFIHPAAPSALSWFSGGSLQFGFGFHIDALTAVMVVVEEAGGMFTDRKGERTYQHNTAVSSNGLLHHHIAALSA